MEKKRAIRLGVALLVIAGGLSWFISRSREPMYEGKPLSYWLECYAPLNRTETSVQEADHAIQAIGTNAIPTLLKMLQKTDSPLKIRLVALLRKQHVVKIKFHPASYYNEIALAGLHALGNSGRPAVPALINIFKHSDSGPSQLYSLVALSELGPTAEAAVPALLNSVSDDSKAVREFICTALGDIHAHPETAVPALMKCLNDPDAGIRAQAAGALGKFGTNAQQAIPVLQQMLKDNDLRTRVYALGSLRQIAPKSAGQLEANQRNPQ